MVKLSHKKLREQMAEKNLKQAPFAEAMGISEKHVYNLCYKDTDVKVSLCYKMSQYFGTSMESLLEIPKSES